MMTTSRPEIPEGTLPIQSRFRLGDLKQRQTRLQELADEDLSECHSHLSPLEQYKKMEPLFRMVFDNADSGK